MNKVLKNIIVVIGIALLTIVTFLNVIFTANISNGERVITDVNKVWFIVIALILAFDVYVINGLLNKSSKKIKGKYWILGAAILAYIIGQVIWINQRDACPAVDQKTAYEVAKGIAEGNLDKVIQKGTTYASRLPNTTYLEVYNQQFTLGFVWSILFRICCSNSFVVIEYFNAICNGITILAIFLICKELSKKYEVNKYLAITLILTFATIPLLSIFIYGDLSSLAFATLSIYFIMKYSDKEKIRYALISAVFMLVAYMLRMNMLIFLIAVLIYLFLDLIGKKSNIKQIALKVAMIISFAVIVMAPATITKNYYCSKHNLDKNKTFPVTGYLYMGMSEAYSSPGWFRYEYADYSYKDVESAKKKYNYGIKERLNYFLKNPTYAFKFYLYKTTSMWAENTYAGIYYNYSNCFLDLNHVNKELDKKLEDFEIVLKLYQKALILVIFGCSILVIIQNRRNLSNEVVLLLTIFIGGFLFHTLWEAKSRYIIPYIIVLIPLAAIKINKIKIDKMKKS